MGQGSSISVSCSVGCRQGLDPALLWLWLWPVATVPIQPLAWELTYAVGEDLKGKKTNKQKKKKQKKRKKRKEKAFS